MTKRSCAPTAVYRYRACLHSKTRQTRGRKNAAECGGNGRGLATAGMIISIVWMVLAFVIGIAVGCAAANAVTNPDYYYYYTTY